jgi:hypothetical protein
MIDNGSGIEKRKWALSTLARAIIEPTERSIPAVKITSSIPILTIPIPAICLSRLKMFLSVKNAFDAIEETTSRTTKMKIVLYFSKKWITFLISLSHPLIISNIEQGILNFEIHYSSFNI